MGDGPNARQQFLLTMYGEMWSNINRHILVVWQSVGVVLGAVVLFGLVEKRVINPDIATSAFIVILTWHCAHVIDARAWFRRNLKIITNIERQFLLKNDSKDIHPFFEQDSKKDSTDHLRIQWWLGVALGILVLGTHLFTRVTPGIGDNSHDLQPERALPYIVALVGAVTICVFSRSTNAKFDAFLLEAPGRDLDT